MLQMSSKTVLSAEFHLRDREKQIDAEPPDKYYAAKQTRR